MNNRFKGLIRIALLFICLTLMFTSSDIVYAKDFDDNSIYLKSHEVDSNVYRYAETNLDFFVSALPDVLEGTNLQDIDLESAPSLGSPFIVGDISYFPMLIKNEIVALVSIFKDTTDYNQLTWSLSTDFSIELNKLRKQTTKLTPASLSVVNNNIIATIDDETIKLTNNPQMDINISSSDSNLLTINILKDTFKSKLNGVSTKTSTFSTRYKYLALDLLETQGGESWCSAYAGAQILRYKGSSTYARTIMQHFYPNSSSAKLKEQSISHSQLISYANMKNSYPTRVVGTILTSTIQNQINTGRPIYMGTYGTGSYNKARHAFVLRGYNIDSGLYSVWNPWNKSYISMPMSTKTIGVTGGTFVWDVTIYGW